MQTYEIPQKESVSAQNQSIFDNLKGKLGFVPNLYAIMAYSDHALNNYLQLQNSPTSLGNREKEAINLVVSQVNECLYCLSAHTVVGKMNGFTDEQVLELRTGSASFDSKLNTLVRLAKEITETKGHPQENTLEAFFGAGYTRASLVDVITAIADKIIMNYLHNITQVPIDFPEASSMEVVA